jgi:hypothetical protein
MNIPRPKTFHVWKQYGNDSPFTDVIVNDTIILFATMRDINPQLGNLALGYEQRALGTGSCLIGGHNNTVHGNDSVIIGGHDQILNDDNVLLFDGDIKLRDNRMILLEIDEMRNEIRELNRLIQEHINGNQQT